MQRLPDFMIIGAMKCATSTLHEQLARQPGIFMSEPKEPVFFSDDPVYERGLDWYSSLFAAAPEGALCGESSTHYTKLPDHPHTVERVAAHVPEARFVYVMRHPIDRLVSHYVHWWTNRRVDGDIHQALAERPQLVDWSRYAMQLEPWLETFGADRVLPVFYDRLQRHPADELVRICRFVGLGSDPVWDDELATQNVSSQRLRASRWRDAVVEAPGLRWLRQRLIPASVRARVASLWTMRSRPRLSDTEVERLSEVFDEDLAVLGAWLGADLSCETFTAATAEDPLDWVAPPPGGRRSPGAAGVTPRPS